MLNLTFPRLAPLYGSGLRIPSLDPLAEEIEVEHAPSEIATRWAEAQAQGDSCPLHRVSNPFPSSPPRFDQPWFPPAVLAWLQTLWLAGQQLWRALREQARWPVVSAALAQSVEYPFDQAWAPPALAELLDRGARARRITAYWMRRWRWPLLSVAIARVVLPPLAVIGQTVLPVQGPTHAHGLPGPSSSALHQALIGAWTHWDGLWFIWIAGHGYGGDPRNIAYFPLYPLLANLVSRVWLPVDVASLLVSLLATVAACVYLFELGRLEFGERVGAWAALFLALAPMGVFLYSSYSDSLFLLAAIAALYHARRGQWWAAGFWVGLACLTRASGVVLWLPLAWEYAQQVGWRPRQLRRDVLALGLGPLSLLSFMVYARSLYGSWSVLFQAEAWWGRSTSWPWMVLGRAMVAAMWSPPGLHDPLSRPAWFDVTRFSHADQTNLLFTLLSLVLVAAAWRWLPTMYAIYGSVAIFFVLTTTTTLMPLMSAPRYELMLVPIPLLLALPKPLWARVGLLGLSAAAFALFTILQVNWYWVA